jgi:hypothetical protein
MQIQLQLQLNQLILIKNKYTITKIVIYGHNLVENSITKFHDNRSGRIGILIYPFHGLEFV